MKKLLKTTLLALTLGLVITLSTYLVKREVPYIQNICDSKVLLDSTVTRTITTHYQVRGLPWPYSENYDELTPSNCPVADQAVIESSFSTLKGHFVEDFIVWLILSFAVIKIYGKKQPRKK